MDNCKDAEQSKSNFFIACPLYRTYVTLKNQKQTYEKSHVRDEY
jgi:hypothetical protein